MECHAKFHGVAEIGFDGKSHKMTWDGNSTGVPRSPEIPLDNTRGRMSSHASNGTPRGMPWDPTGYHGPVHGIVWDVL